MNQRVLVLPDALRTLRRTQLPTIRQFLAYAASWEPIPEDGLPRHSNSRHMAPE